LLVDIKGFKELQKKEKVLKILKLILKITWKEYFHSWTLKGTPSLAIP